MKKLLSVLICVILFSTQVCAQDLRFVQVTDVRYSKTSDNNVLAKLVNDINKQKDINFVVFTGDNISHPSNDDLKAFMSEIKKLKIPYYLVIGDKDVNKRKDMSKKQYLQKAHKYGRKFKQFSPNYVFEKSGVVFLVVDGSKDVIPSSIGYYKDNVLEWVDANLDLYSDRNVIILQHFPIIPPAEKESHYTYKADSYIDMLQKHSNVKAVVSGHFGVNKEQPVNGIMHISTAPLPFYRVIDILDCDTKDPSIWAQVKEVK